MGDVGTQPDHHPLCEPVALLLVGTSESQPTAPRNLLIWRGSCHHSSQQPAESWEPRDAPEGSTHSLHPKHPPRGTGSALPAGLLSWSTPVSR